VLVSLIYLSSIKLINFSSLYCIVEQKMCLIFINEFCYLCFLKNLEGVCQFKLMLQLVAVIYSYVELLNHFDLYILLIKHSIFRQKVRLNLGHSVYAFSWFKKYYFSST
jgi:hypothetical protein